MGPDRTAVGKTAQGEKKGDAPEASEVIESSSATRLGIYLFGFAMFLAGFAAVFLATLPWVGPATVIAGVLVGALCCSCIRIAAQWECAIILRFGRFHRAAGSGVYFVVPFIDYVAVRVDQRVRSVTFSTEKALTLDLVPVDIDAVIFWLVWDAKKACLEVENYPNAVLWSAQTALRDAIGKLNLADLSPRRKQVDNDLQMLLGEKCEQWGVSIISVEIRDITIPDDLQNALSQEAQAQSERNARMMLAEAEKDISEMLVEAAEIYDRNPAAMKLKAMNLAYSSAKDGRGLILTPTELAEGFWVTKPE